MVTKYWSNTKLYVSASVMFQVYHTYFDPLEWTVPHRDENTCYAKLICLAAQKVCATVTQLSTVFQSMFFTQEIPEGVH